MATVGVGTSCFTCGLAALVNWLGSTVGGRRTLFRIHQAKRTAGELWQWLGHDDSSINIVLAIMIITIIVTPCIQFHSYLLLITGHSTQHPRVCNHIGPVLPSLFKLYKIWLVDYHEIFTTVAIRCHILRLKCTKFDFGCNSAPDPAGGTYSAPPDLLAGF